MKLESQLQIYTLAGVAPFTVNQATLVTNLNAQYLEGQIGSYYRNAGNLDAGALLAARLPAFTGGDVTSTAGTVALTLAFAGTAGTYRSVTTDAKGRVTAGTNPTTLAGYGITDALLLSGGTLIGELVINYSNGRQRITDGTNTLVMGLWDTVNIRIEANGRPLYMVSYGGAISIGRSSGTNLVIDTASVSWGSNALLHAGNYTSYPPARWATGRTISLTGDVTGTSVAFDGTTALSFAATLANSGATAGTYTKVTVNAKGLVTAGASLASADLPTYTGTITGTQVTTGLGFTPYNATNPSGYITSSGSITGNSATATNGFTVKPGWAENQNLIAATGNLNSSVPSGFYEGLNATNSPSAATWYNLINVRHSNAGNDHGFQLAMSYYDETLWSRSYQGGTGANNGTFTTWRAHLHSGNFNSYALPLAGGTLTGTITATNYIGPGTGLTGTATSLNIGGSAAQLGGLDNSRYHQSARATFASGNWDSMSSHGTYKIQHADFTLDTNPPPSSYGYGICEVTVSEVGGENRIQQMYWPHASDNYFYQRMRNNTSWTSWYKIYRNFGGIALDSANYGTYALPIAGGTLTGSITATNHIGPGTGLTGTAPGLNIGGNCNNITQYVVNQNVGTGNTPSFTGLSVVNTITGAVSGSSGSCTGNAASATGQQSGAHFTLNTGGVGYGLVGAYDADKHQGLFAMGPSYTLAAGGTLANFYGVSWSYDYSGRQLNTGYNLQHCLAIANAGTVYTVIGQGIWTSGLIRANGAISSGGTITAAAFSGPLTGNVTGNTSGSATFLNSSNYIGRCGSTGNANTDFQNTPAGSVRHNGDDSNLTNSPGATWWFYDNYRHSNGSNYWGTQVAWGWEDNANKLATRNVTGGTFGAWVYYLNSANYNSYTPTFGGTGATGTWPISITGNAASVTNATFYRQFTVRDDRSDASDYSLAARPTGLYAINAAGTNGPGTTYLSLIHVANSNDVAFQIAGGYNNDAMYFRGTSALQTGTGYSPWRTVIHSGTIASQTVATAGSCTGSAAQLNGQAASYYENRDTTAVGFSAGTLTLTRAVGNLTVSLDGRYLTANQAITLSGDVTGSGTTSIVATIANSTVTNAKLNTMGAATIKGNNGAVANSPSDLTPAQVATMLSGQTMNIAGSSTSCTGNAVSASAVAWSGITSKPTTISGFGIADIVSSNSGSPVAADTTTKNGFYYVGSNISLFGQTDGALFVQAYDNTWASQIYQDYRTGQLAIRGRNSGTWQAWRTVLDSTNFTGSMPNSGVTAGTYNNVTVNAKGIVTGGLASPYMLSTGASMTGSMVIQGGTNSLVAQESGSAAQWYGRVGSANGTSDRYVFLGTYGAFGAIRCQVNSTGAVADLYINTVDGSTGGTVRMPSSVLINGNQALHAGSTSAPSLSIGGSSTSCTGNAASATTAGNVNGYGTSGGVGANTIVIRDSAGYIYANYINTNVSESENPSVNSFFTSNGDGWLRKSTVAHVKYTLSLSGSNTGDQTNISGSSGSCNGNAASVTDGVYLSTNQSISGVKTFSSAPVATNIAKAWVRYNMFTNTIDASFNVSSVTDNGTGDCTVNFASSMVDANYVVAGTATYGYDNQVIHAMQLSVPRISNAQQAGSCRLVTEYMHAAAVYDCEAVRAVFYR